MPEATPPPAQDLGPSTTTPDHAAVTGPDGPAPLLGLVPAAGVSLSAFLLFGAHQDVAGYATLALSLLAAYLVHRPLARDLLLIAIGIGIVSTTSVEADISWDRFFLLGFVLTAAVVTPVLVDRLVYRREPAILFPWFTGRRWTRMQWAYVVAVPVLGYLILPSYFINSGAYQNWPPIQTPSEFGRFFVGVNAVGLWDELFFMCVCFALLRRHFPLWQANVLQAVIFVSFLWELGYRSWGPLLTIPFALLQGYIFTRTKSLTYVVIIHLLFDAVVFFAIVHAHDRSIFPFFLY